MRSDEESITAGASLAFCWLPLRPKLAFQEWHAHKRAPAGLPDRVAQGMPLNVTFSQEGKVSSQFPRVGDFTVTLKISVDLEELEGSVGAAPWAQDVWGGRAGRGCLQGSLGSIWESEHGVGKGCCMQSWAHGSVYEVGWEGRRQNQPKALTSQTGALSTSLSVV